MAYKGVYLGASALFAKDSVAYIRKRSFVGDFEHAINLGVPPTALF